MTLIKMLRPPRSAFNKNRPVSNLLQAQIRHLQEAEFNLIKTEGQAAEYIRRVTAILHPQGAPAKKKMKVVKKAKSGRVKEIAAAAGKKTKKKSAAKKSSRRKKK